MRFPPGEPILHISMPVRDLEESRRFYVDVLGCEPGRVMDRAIDVFFFGAQLTLHERPDEVLAPEHQGVRHFGATVADHAVARTWSTASVPRAPCSCGRPPPITPAPPANSTKPWWPTPAATPSSSRPTPTPTPHSGVDRNLL